MLLPQRSVGVINALASEGVNHAPASLVVINGPISVKKKVL